MIAPDLGIIVVEVKGWFLDDIIEGNNIEVTTNFNDRERVDPHPLEQARNYMWRLAALFTEKNARNNEDSISSIPVDPSLAMRCGPKPIVLKCENRADECDRIVKIAHVLLDGNVPFNDMSISLKPEDIGILYLRKPYRENAVFSQFLKDLGTLAPVTWLNENYYSWTKVFEKTIKVQTVASSKGLTYRVVFVMWADLFGPNTPADLELKQRKLYVALTRAADVVIVTYSERSEFMDRMVGSGEVVGK